MEVSGEGRELWGARGVLVMGERKSTSEVSWSGDPREVRGEAHTRGRILMCIIIMHINVGTYMYMTNHVHRALQKEKARKKERKGKEEKEAVNRKRQRDILIHNTHTSPTASNFHHD